jgi:hypothetical protein
MAVLTIAGVWIGLVVVAAVLFNRFVHFSESRPIDLGMSPPGARKGLVLRGSRTAYSRAGLSRHTAVHAAAQLRWRQSLVARRASKLARRKAS